MPTNFNGHFICNVHLGICTCLHFINRGQPYYCKHLYACLSVIMGIKTTEDADINKLLDGYISRVPKVPEYLNSHLKIL